MYFALFSPYLSSPVKQRVQAFEKHAQGGTPAKFNTMPPKYVGNLKSIIYAKYTLIYLTLQSTLKNGTPSKLGLYSKTTPLSVGRNPSSSTFGVNAASTAQMFHKPPNKFNSLSQESLDEMKKNQQAILMAQLLEDKKKAREDKQKQAQLIREAMEKDKRDLALKQQMEREEKFNRIRKEKEEKQRMELLKKKIQKESQAKKYAEEKAKTEEKAKKQDFLSPKPVDSQTAKMNDSLHLKMQKQIMLEKTAQQRKAETKHTYNFDMLHTDDSTDDESRPSKKRPTQPDWSKSENYTKDFLMLFYIYLIDFSEQKRKPMIVMQSHINTNVLDSLFSVQPISVDLREIFPAIDSRKLIRNSSAIWRTPPKH